FNLIGTTYGGDGQSTFALPDLRGRVPIHTDSNSLLLAETGGAEEITLTVSQTPAHSHPFVATTLRGTQATPGGSLAAQSLNVVPWINDAPGVSFSPGAIQSTGGSQPHTNFQPYLCLNFIISLFGIFPSQT